MWFGSTGSVAEFFFVGNPWMYLSWKECLSKHWVMAEYFFSQPARSFVLTVEKIPIVSMKKDAQEYEEARTIPYSINPVVPKGNQESQL